VRRFLIRGKKVPKRCRIFQIRLRVPLLRVYEGWKLGTIIDEEYRRLIHHHVKVSLFRIEFDRKTTRVSSRVRRSFLSTDCRKTDRDARLLPNFTQKICRALREVSQGSSVITPCGKTLRYP